MNASFSASEGEAEGKVVSALAKDIITHTPAEDVYCFVANGGDEIVATVMLSRMHFDNKLSDSANAFILSPVAVSPEHQNRGIGQSIINHAIDVLKQQNVALLFTYGDPAYYKKVGFNPITESQIKAPQPLSYPHGWLCQSLTDTEIPHVDGDTKCVPALDKPEYW